MAIALTILACGLLLGVQASPGTLPGSGARELSSSSGTRWACNDSPGEWRSKSGSTCSDYVSQQWCTASGGYGVGWDLEQNGTFADFARDGVSAHRACCGCGGGSDFVFERVGEGRCRAGCDGCEVNGLRRDHLTDATCQAACEARGDCIGFSISLSPPWAKTVCYVHISTPLEPHWHSLDVRRGIIPSGWESFPRGRYDIAGASGVDDIFCYRRAIATAVPTPAPTPPPAPYLETADQLCPEGYEDITTAPDCDAARASLGISTFRGERTDGGSRRPFCYAGTSGVANFNSNGDFGDTWGRAASICALRAPAPALTETPALPTVDVLP